MNMSVVSDAAVVSKYPPTHSNKVQPEKVNEQSTIFPTPIVIPTCVIEEQFKRILEISVAPTATILPILLRAEQLANTDETSVAD